MSDKLNTFSQVIQIIKELYKEHGLHFSLGVEYIKGGDFLHVRFPRNKKEKQKHFRTDDPKNFPIWKGVLYFIKSPDFAYAEMNISAKKDTPLALSSATWQEAIDFLKKHLEKIAK